ncbi:MAG: hypothetical protein GY903_01810 [Fuerstiella sp.]|nr:hypothetical protein [Fuerstiella sp.]MCP4853214.1 hypothetical protein [Fuerstiella sp.]
MSDTEEITAWHEAGHAFAAVYLGAIVDSVSIDPDHDDGPNRFGDTVVQWERSAVSGQELAEKSILVALAGPVAEMIHRGDPFHPATVSEWSLDWQLAWQAANFVKAAKERLTFLERLTVQLHQTLSQQHHWAAIGAIVDHLLAHEVLEGETVHEIVAAWSD